MLIIVGSHCAAGPSVPSATDSKVHARLLSARALGAAVAQTVASLRAVLLPPPDAGAGVGAGGDAEADEDENENEEDEPDSDREVEANGDADDADEAGWESGSVDAGSDEEGDDDGWESGSVHSDAAPPPKKAAATTKSATKSAATKPTPAPTKTSTASQFLPSLAVGYVRGGSSDSEVEDVEEAGGERKNRRGQRARRA